MAFGCFGGPCLGKGAVSRERTTASGAKRYNGKIAAGSKTESAISEESVAQGPLYEQPAPQGRRSGGTSEESPASQLEDMKTLPDQLQADGRSGRLGTQQGLDLQSNQATAATTDPAASQVTEETATTARIPMGASKSGGTLEERHSSQQEWTGTMSNQAVAATASAASQVPEGVPTNARTRFDIDNKGEPDLPPTSSSKPAAGAPAAKAEAPSQGAVIRSSSDEGSEAIPNEGGEGARRIPAKIIPEPKRQLEAIDVVSLSENLQDGATWMKEFATGLSVKPEALRNSILAALGNIVGGAVDVGEALPYVGAAFKILNLIISVVKKEEELDASVKELQKVAQVMVENLRETSIVHEVLEQHVKKLFEALCKASALVKAYDGMTKRQWIWRRVMTRGSDNNLVITLIQEIKDAWDGLARMASVQVLAKLASLPEVSFVPDPLEEELRAELTPANLDKLKKNDKEYMGNMMRRLPPTLQIELKLIEGLIASRDNTPAPPDSAVCKEPDEQKLKSNRESLVGADWRKRLESVETEIAEGQSSLIMVYGRSGSGMTTFCEQVRGSTKVRGRFSSWRNVYYLKGIGQVETKDDQVQVNDHCRELLWQLYERLQEEAGRKADKTQFLGASLRVQQRWIEDHLRELDILLILDGVVYDKQEKEAFDLKTFDQTGSVLFSMLLSTFKLKESKSDGPHKELSSILDGIVKALTPCLPARVERIGRRLQGTVDKKRWQAELQKLKDQKAHEDKFRDAFDLLKSVPSGLHGERLQTLFLLVAALPAVADPLVADAESFLQAWAASWDLELEDAERDIDELRQRKLLFRGGQGRKRLSVTPLPEIISDGEETDGEEEVDGEQTGGAPSFGYGLEEGYRDKP
ncbi:hypothetical protein KFL_010280015 [Klebsormidium nitens]|uniref:Uncharacterized protein n=1 Tax=Klebsormidium nitens TaxID=105231 RepID=A0A1Y1IR18_KLENI|nr:hypothetical protein KFL_010280015 [Klebsormidium nitens]|eukprot:GAQ92492.1 hypothetical protein KFL_010280015 [Klebsormidium nitens]